MRKQNRSPLRRAFTFCAALILACLGAGLSSSVFAGITKVTVTAGKVSLSCGSTFINPLPAYADIGVATAFTPGSQTKVTADEEATECGGLLGQVQIYDIMSSNNEAIANANQAEGFAQSEGVSLLGGLVSFDSLSQYGECHDSGPGARGCTSQTIIEDLYFAGEHIQIPDVVLFNTIPRYLIDVGLFEGACGFLTAGRFTGELTLNKFRFEGDFDTGNGTMRLIPVSFYGILDCVGYPTVRVLFETGVEVTGTAVGSLIYSDMTVE